MHGGNEISFSQNKTTELGGRSLLRFVAFRNNEANKTRTLQKGKSRTRSNSRQQHPLPHWSGSGLCYTGDKVMCLIVVIIALFENPCKRPFEITRAGMHCGLCYTKFHVRVV